MFSLKEIEEIHSNTFFVKKVDISTYRAADFFVVMPRDKIILLNDLNKVPKTANIIINNFSEAELGIIKRQRPEATLIKINFNNWEIVK